MRNDPTVVALVLDARTGDKVAWDAIVDRYAPLVWSICGRYRLSVADADDVGQTIFLRLVVHLPQLKEPAALPGWIATATRRECLRVIQEPSRRHASPVALESYAEEASAVDEAILARELNIALRDAFRHLPAHCRQLLSLLFEEPPLPYSEVARRLEMKIGSIGPTRQRCLQKLRECPALAAFAGDALEPGPGGGTRG